MLNKNTIVFDLDDTICFPNHKEKRAHEKYALAKPNERVIEKIRKLHNDGWKIAINTARRMVTFNGDLDLIEANVGDITRDWLKNHNVPYDELRFGKPYGEWYVDDKAMTIDMFMRKF